MKNKYSVVDHKVAQAPLIERRSSRGSSRLTLVSLKKFKSMAREFADNQNFLLDVSLGSVSICNRFEALFKEGMVDESIIILEENAMWRTHIWKRILFLSLQYEPN